MARFQLDRQDADAGFYSAATSAREAIRVHSSTQPIGSKRMSIDDDVVSRSIPSMGWCQSGQLDALLRQTS